LNARTWIQTKTLQGPPEVTRRYATQPIALQTWLYTAK